MTNDWLPTLLERVHAWERLGKHTPERGQTFIGLPHDEDGNYTGKTWLHRLFPPLSETELAEMEAGLKVTLPDDFRRVYRTMNGLSFFDDMVVMHGWVNERTAIFTFAQGMYSIQRLNTIDRPWDALSQHFFFGSLKRFYNAHARLYIDLRDGRIHLTKHTYTAEPMASWDSLPELLTSEFDRAEGLFSPNGQRSFKLPEIDEDVLKRARALYIADRVSKNKAQKS